MQTIAKYKTEEVRNEFPKLVATLILEMEESLENGTGSDVLGTFYEMHLYRKGAAQYFTPWPICQLMAHCLPCKQEENEEPMRVVDPCCGSGRMLLANALANGKEHYYYGINIDHTCVKMAAINLFLNGVFHSEVMCADALSPNDFRMSYAISFLPFGIFRIENKEQSRLWHMHVNSFKRKQSILPDLKLPSEDGTPVSNGSQLQLF